MNSGISNEKKIVFSFHSFSRNIQQQEDCSTHLLTTKPLGAIATDTGTP